LAISTGLFSILAELVQLKQTISIPEAPIQLKRTILTPADLIQLKRTILTQADLFQLQQPNSYPKRFIPILIVRLYSISRTFVFQLHITAYTNNLWMI
jgi:hypothetical protein